MKVKVLKFGGTSVGSVSAIHNTISRVKECDADLKFVLVSAFSGITDLLVKISDNAVSALNISYETIEMLKYRHLNIINELFPENEYKIIAEKFVIDKANELVNLCSGINFIEEITPKIKDEILSFGEILSSAIISFYIKSLNLDCHLLDSRKIIKTDSNFNSAHVDFDESAKSLNKYQFSNEVFCSMLQGFIGSDSNNITTTLGRGGSDYSASVLANLLKSNGYDVEEVQIWTDVDGILSADPRIINNTKIINTMSINEVLELSYFGAKVLHPDTLKPAIEFGIPVRVLNTFNPNSNGTQILKDYESKTICSLVLIKDIYFLNFNLFDNNQDIYILFKLLEIINNLKGKIYFQSYNGIFCSLIFSVTDYNVFEYINLENFVLEKIDLIALVGSNILPSNNILNEYNFDVISGYSDHSIFIKCNSENSLEILRILHDRIINNN